MKKKWIIGGCVASSCATIGCIGALIASTIGLLIIGNIVMMAEMSKKVTKEAAVGTYIGDITTDGKHHRDVLVLRPDGTFDQTYTPPKGRIRKAHGTWKLSYKGRMDGTDITFSNFIYWSHGSSQVESEEDHNTYIYHLNGDVIIGMADIDPDEWGKGYIKQPSHHKH